MNRLGVRVEVWPVAADEHAIWLVAPEADAWRSGIIPDRLESHQAARQILRAHNGYPNAPGGAWDAVMLLHSTSWRADDDAVILTYVAALGGFGSHEYVRDVWPHARPLTLTLTDTVGKPEPALPIDPPTPRYIDVLMHGVRHLAMLRDTDTAARDALDEHWVAHLGRLQPTLAGMYLVTDEAS